MDRNMIAPLTYNCNTRRIVFACLYAVATHFGHIFSLLLLLFDFAHANDTDDY